jgi:hypothetical protein
MKQQLRRIAANPRMTQATHWAVFSLGAALLSISITATAFRAFAS